MMNFPKKIKELRKEKGYSAKELSSLLNLSTNMIYEWEKGRCTPNIQSLCDLSKIFGVSIDYLLDREDDFGNIVISSGQTSDLSVKEKRLLKAFNSLPDIEKNKLIEDAEFYALRHIKQEQH